MRYENLDAYLILSRQEAKEKKCIGTAASKRTRREPVSNPYANYYDIANSVCFI